jgi:hypothetical protein
MSRSNNWPADARLPALKYLLLDTVNVNEIASRQMIPKGTERDFH